MFYNNYILTKGLPFCIPIPKPFYTIKNEFVSILGASGSGKTTLLNIIGGLDHYTFGDLIINNISTKEYKSSDWDMYRNHKIGFIFQSYNLISHQTILSNVELALTLSGIKKADSKKRAIEALKKVGLENHLNKEPRQLSGGQMQRVAIARALVNNPEIVLADEPTGALDSKTSVQIMDLLNEIAKDKLVIMVTHNPELAREYSTRIITLKDGQIVSDTKPYDGKIEEDYKPKQSKHKSMSLLTALSLSLNNLITKKGRTILNAIAGSIGIIGIALILALSNGINNYMNNMQHESSSYMPLSINETATSIFNFSDLTSSLNTEQTLMEDGLIKTTDDISKSQYVNNVQSSKKNNIKKFKEYILENEDNFKKFTSNIEYKYDIDLQIYTMNNEEIIKVNPQETTGDSNSTSILNTSFNEITSDEEIFNENYELIDGKLPKQYNELVLVVDENNQIPLSVVYSLGIENKSDFSEILQQLENKEDLNIKKYQYKYSDLLDKSYKLILNTNFYEKDNGIWLDKSNYINYVQDLYNNGIDLKVVGIVKVKSTATASSGFIGYTNELTNYIIENNLKSDIAKEQLSNTKVNVLTNTPFDDYSSTYEDNIKKLGIRSLDTPSLIELYPKNYESKLEIKKIIEEYNNNTQDKITYEDTIETLNSGVKTTVNIITYVLIGFIAISLIVSSIMISIITYISVLERTKEIGILRAIGASKKDIKRVFRAETIIEGFISGTLGVLVSVILIIIINVIIGALSKINNFASLPIFGAVILIAISVLLTLLAGSIPSNMASKKDPVESLRSE